MQGMPRHAKPLQLFAYQWFLKRGAPSWRGQRHVACVRGTPRRNPDLHSTPASQKCLSLLERNPEK